MSTHKKKRRISKFRLDETSPVDKPAHTPARIVIMKRAVDTDTVQKRMALTTGTDGHAQAGACWLSSAAPDELSPAGYPLRRTLDQIIAAETGKKTAFRSLELSCNPSVSTAR